MYSLGHRLPRWLLGGLALATILLTSGAAFGWAAMVLLLKRDGAYAWLCGGADGCKEQDLALSTAFTVASTASLLSALPAGAVLDRFGPRVTGSLSLSLFLAGILMLGWCSQQRPWYRDLIIK